jgi:hypothetical protein
MPTWRHKPANREYLNKRYTPDEQQAQTDAACSATQRLYCDELQAWRGCTDKRCRRHLRCSGDPAACFARVRERHEISNAVWAAVIRGGPGRIPPATHREWVMRRTPPDSL